MSRQVSQSPLFERKKKLLLSLGAHENFYRDLKRYLA